MVGTTDWGECMTKEEVCEYKHKYHRPIQAINQIIRMLRKSVPLKKAGFYQCEVCGYYHIARVIKEREKKI